MLNFFMESGDLVGEKGIFWTCNGTGGSSVVVSSDWSKVEFPCKHADREGVDLARDLSQ